jgi:alpha-ketoglutarate-dependent taurine dioxygenase
VAFEKLLRELSRNGYAVTRAKNEGAVLSIAERLGTPLREQRDSRVYRLISPTTAEASLANTLSSRYGLGSFPFHTDTAYWLKPARFLLLHCVNPGSGARPTLLLDTARWRLRAAESRLLTRGLWITAGARPFLATVLSPIFGGFDIRYDVDCMRPAATSGEEAGALIRRKIRASHTAQVDWIPRMLLVIDNRRLLHSRGDADAPDMNRQLGRVLVGDSP